jgi:hypothetical protein
MGEKKYSSRIRLDSDQLRVPPAGKKSSPYPSGQVPDAELPSLDRIITCKI